ncbi:putative proton-dependent oligopeptide transporter family, MFS transporter superfamily [Dioscorea sansibarensis]
MRYYNICFLQSLSSINAQFLLYLEILIPIFIYKRHPSIFHPSLHFFLFFFFVFILIFRMNILSEISEKDEYVDWRGRSVQPNKHGGKRMALLVCLTEILENAVLVANISNLVVYFHSNMNYTIPESSNMLTNFTGTCLLLTLFSGFIADSFLKRFWCIILFGILELLGLLILTIQAFEPSLRPNGGEKPSNPQEAMLYIGLYVMALGVSGVKANLASHGADQLDPVIHGQQIITSFFNGFFFCLCTGGMLAVTILVWIQVNRGWKLSMILCTIFLFLAIFIFSLGFKYYRHKVPGGSPFTRIFKVLGLSFINRKHSQQSEESRGSNGKKFRFLEKAILAGEHASIEQVEEARSFLRLLPIFGSTIMMNCCLAQLQTFSVQQGHLMNTKLSNSFSIPPASLTAIPLSFMLLSVPIFHHLSTSQTITKLTGTNFSLKPLKRIGVGLVLASISMAVASLVEIKRRRAFSKGGHQISVLWLSFQYLLLGVSDMFTLAGMLEFFYSEAPETMKSVCTSLSWCSTSMGYFLSSILVSIVNKVSKSVGGVEWLAESLNAGHLEFFYALLALLNLLSFFNFLFWAKWYSK